MILTIESEPECVRGILAGRLDTAAAIKFEKDMAPLIECADRYIVLDCSSLEYICSSGLRQFLTLCKAVAAKGGRLEIAGMSGPLREVFTMTGLARLFVFT